MVSAEAWRRRGVVATMMAPTTVGVLAFTLVPVVFVAVWSFTSYDLVSSPKFVGLQNYRFAANGDPFIGQAVHNTIWMLAVGLPIQLVVALALALVLAKPGRARAATRTVVFLPSVLPPVAATLVFGWIMQPGRGLVDRMLGGLHLPQPLWFSDPRWAKPGLLLLGLWGIGPTMILFVAGLVRIPRAQYEMALLEGAGAWRRFRTITLPSLLPVLLFTVVLGVVGTLQYFTQAFVASGNLTGTKEGGLDGAPLGSTRFYSNLMYRNAFLLFHFGYAAMLAAALFVVAIVAMALLLLIAKRFEPSPSGP